MYGLGAVAGEQREVMDFARRPGFDDEPRRRPQALAHQVLVDGGRREQRGNRQRRRRYAAIGQDQDVVALADRVFRVGGQARERRFHAVRAPLRRIADIEFDRLERPRREEFDVPDLLHVVGRQDRLLRLEPHRRHGDVDAEQVRPRADERDERHHEFLADRVDRRIRDLREQLLEIVVEDLRAIGQDRQRGVVAHRAQRFLAALRHRPEQDLDVLLRVSERLLAIEQRDFRGLRRRGLGHFLEPQPAIADPVAVRLGRRERALQFVVVDDAALLQVDEQHLPGLQPPLLDDLALGDVEHAHFGRHDDVVVVGDDEPRGPQAVAVERGADLAAVREGHRRRTVPRLHQRRVVFVEGAPVLVHQRVACPRLRNHHHHRVRQRIPAHHQQFERVVERRGIGLAVVDQRPQLRQVVAQHLRRDRAFARADPVEIAAHGVDLAVVRDVAERMREIPRRKRVGREALVHHRERRDHRFVGQVAVVPADLMGEQHSLVDDRPRRQRRHVELAAVPQLQRLDRMTGALADHVELPLERVLVDVAPAAADEELPDHRLDFLRPLRKPAVVGRNVAPAEQDLPFGGDRALDLLLAGHSRRRLLREEHHADAVLPDGRQRDAELAARAAQEGVRQLDQDARAVALQRIGAGRAPMREIFEDRQRVADDGVILATLDVRDEPETAGVVLIGRIVEPLPDRRPH